MNIPLIEPAFADKIASRYVAIYKGQGFTEAKTYLDRMVGESSALREYLIPLIVKKGEELQ